MRGYFVYDKWECTGTAVIANDAKEAKRIGFPSVQEMHGSEWVEVAAVWVRGADVSGIEKPGELSLIDGLRRGIYAWLEDTNCEICGINTKCECHDGKVICEDCLEKLAAEAV